MRRHHHALAGREIERLAGGKVAPRLGLEITCNLGAENRVPRKAVAARERYHQRDVSVRHRRDHELALEAREAGCRVGPAVEAMPGEVEFAELVRGNALQAE